VWCHKNEANIVVFKCLKWATIGYIAGSVVADMFPHDVLKAFIIGYLLTIATAIKGA
jgi:hypothetical protein